VAEKLGSYAENRQPMMGPVKVPGRLVEKVVDLGAEVGMTGSLEVAGQPGRPRTRDRGDLHLGLSNGSLVLGFVVLSGGLAGVCGRLEFVA
jgi:hypothetical protein